MHNLRWMIVVGATLAVAGDAQASPKITVAALHGEGDWTVDQDYGQGAGVRFEQHFSFRLRAGQRTQGAVVHAPIRVSVTSKATGALLDATVSPPQPRPYTCTATSVTRDTATVRLV